MNWDLLATYVARAVALLTAIPVHESAHAWASDKLGDPTAKRYGRLSLNPLRHFDFLGALCMIFVGFGWAKPVPIAAATNFRHPRRDMALSAAAGPASNLLLAFLCMIFTSWCTTSHPARRAGYSYPRCCSRWCGRISRWPCLT
ncbi:MAG: site-2 protease family protein [Ruthenibacterium lactatiformans]